MDEKKILTGEASPEQVNAWKQQHGDVYIVKVEGSAGYLRKPDRDTMKAVASIGSSDPVRSNEVLLENCWLGGDESIKTDDAKFFGVSATLAELVEVKAAELKKL